MAEAYSITVASPGLCSVCGVLYTLPQAYIDKRREDGVQFYCPNGHVQMFGGGPVDKLTREVRQLRGEVDRTNENLKSANASANYLRKEKTTYENRCARHLRTISRLKKKLAGLEKKYGVGTGVDSTGQEAQQSAVPAGDVAHKKGSRPRASTAAKASQEK